MAKRLYSFPNSAEAQDELASVCERLDEAQIEHYNTPGSVWGFSKATLWIKNESDYDKAKEIFERHVIEYADEARQRYQQETGYDPDASADDRFRFFLRHISQRKGAVIALVAGIALLYIYFEQFFRHFSQ